MYSVTRGEDGELVKNDSGEVARNDTNGDGEVADGDSITIEKGTLNNIENTNYTNSEGKTLDIQLIDVTNASAKDTKSLFEFLSNGKIEFSYSSWFTNSKKFIGTSFELLAENSINVLYPRYKYLLHHVHSHPDGFLEPSMEGGDVTAAALLEKRLGYRPRLEVYSPFLRQYKDYNKDSAWSLDEIIINVPKNNN